MSGRSRSNKNKPEATTEDAVTEPVGTAVINTPNPEDPPEAPAAPDDPEAPVSEEEDPAFVFGEVLHTEEGEVEKLRAEIEKIEKLRAELGKVEKLRADLAERDKRIGRLELAITRLAEGQEQVVVQLRDQARGAQPTLLKPTGTTPARDMDSLEKPGRGVRGGFSNGVLEYQASTAPGERDDCVIGNYKLTIGGRQYRVKHGTPVEGLPKSVQDALEEADATILPLMTYDRREGKMVPSVVLPPRPKRS